MASVSERLKKWRETRTFWQKAGDIAFWGLLVLLIIPGPRKVISTALNRVVLQIKSPALISEDKQVALSTEDYQWGCLDENGEQVSLLSLRDRVVFLNFWATWCPPCVAEMPEIEKSYRKHGKDVAFLLVTSQEPGVVSSFLEKHGYRLPVYYQVTSPPGILEYGSIPTTFIISREGKIVLRKTGAVNWDSKRTDRILEKLIR